MDKVNEITITKLKNLYTKFGYEMFPYSLKEVGDIDVNLTLPKILIGYYQEVGVIEGEEGFFIRIYAPNELCFFDEKKYEEYGIASQGEFLVFASQTQGNGKFAIKKEQLGLDNPPIYTDIQGAVDGKLWIETQTMNDEMHNYSNLLEFFYTLASIEGVDSEPRNTDENVKIVRAVFEGKLTEDHISEKVIKNITTINLRDVKIQNFKSISKLINLVQIDIYRAGIVDITPVFALPKLTWLQVNGDRIRNLEGIGALKKLKTLALYFNDVEDITPLKELPNIRNISLDSNRIKDISVIGDMPSLISFSACKNKIAQLPVFTSNSKLEEIRLSDNYLSDVSSLTTIDTLKIIWLEGNKLVDIEDLKDLKNLEKIILDEDVKIPEFNFSKPEVVV